MDDSCPIPPPLTYVYPVYSDAHSVPLALQSDDVRRAVQADLVPSATGTKRIGKK